jgi:acetyl-CoA C-acetyltransferase
MDLAAEASRRALAEAGVQAGCIDTIAVVRLFSDSAKAWRSPFGGSDNPPESIARRIGAQLQDRIYSNAGGTEPMQLLAELFTDIAAGNRRMALLAGAEAIATERFARRRDFSLDWSEQFDLPMDNREYLKRFASPEELHSGMFLPAHYYALIENLLAHRLGHDASAHRDHMGNLLAPFSEVAAANPFSQFPRGFTAQEIATINDANYRICHPFSKRLVAQDAVNQAAALLLTSAGEARRLGVNPAHWVFVEAYGSGEDVFLSRRQDPARSEAMERVLRGTLESAEAGAGDMDLVDIYSCFPCAVHTACEALGLPADGSGRLTVTGGLPFFGGPGNNYCLHALAEMTTRLRGGTSRGLVTGNGGILSKHAAAVLGTDPGRAASTDWASGDLLRIAPESQHEQPAAAAPGKGSILSYTVIAGRDKPDRAVVLAETDNGERFLARNDDAQETALLWEHSPIGESIEVHSEEQRNRYRRTA